MGGGGGGEGWGDYLENVRLRLKVRSRRDSEKYADDIDLWQYWILYAIRSCHNLLISVTACNTTWSGLHCELLEAKRDIPHTLETVTQYYLIIHFACPSPCKQSESSVHGHS